jgi:cytochrome c oxidase subunit 2
MSQSTLAPAGPAAEHIATLSWLITGLAAAVMLAVLAYLAMAVLRRRAAEDEPRAVNGTFVVGVFGVGLPLAILLVTFGFALSALAALARPPSPPRLSVEVIGHEWWWEVRYPGHEKRHHGQ